MYNQADERTCAQKPEPGSRQPGPPQTERPRTSADSTDISYDPAYRDMCHRIRTHLESREYDDIAALLEDPKCALLAASVIRREAGRWERALVARAEGSIERRARRLTRQCHAELAKDTGTRYAPVDGGPGTDDLGWQRLGYCYKQPPDIPEVDKGDGTPGTVRPFASAVSDMKADNESERRQLRAELLELRDMQAIAASGQRKEREYKSRSEAFEERHRKPWRYIAQSYFPEDFADDEELDENGPPG